MTYLQASEAAVPELCEELPGQPGYAKGAVTVIVRSGLFRTALTECGVGYAIHNVFRVGFVFFLISPAHLHVLRARMGV